MRYAYRGGEGVPGYDRTVETTLTLTYRNGAWTGTCEGVQRTWVQNGGENGEDRYENVTLRQTVALAPPMGPRAATPGQEVSLTVLAECGTQTDRVDVVGLQSHTAPRHGQPIDAWYAEYEPPNGEPRDTRAWWDDETGLVLAYDFLYSHSGHRGWLVDTDAPTA